MVLTIRGVHFVHPLFLYLETTEGRPTRAIARVGLLLYSTFFGILTTKQTKTAGAVLGCRVLPAPRRDLERLPQNAAGGTGVLYCRHTINRGE